VYHGGEISKAAFSGVQHPVIRDRIKHNIWGVASAGKRRLPQYMDCGGRSATVGFRKIRNLGFPDLRGNEKGQTLL
jgi:hypothetical protein